MGRSIRARGFDGFIYFSPFVDRHGNPVERTKYTHPYSYDGFVLHRLGENSEITGSVYTDRLRERDNVKLERCWDQHMPGKRWDNAEPAEIEAFLRDYLDAPGLRLILVSEYCNHASGYPLWLLEFSNGAS